MQYLRFKISCHNITHSCGFAISILENKYSPIMSYGNDKAHAVVLARVRERQWMYLGPIASTPIAHFCVTLYREAKTHRQKHLLLGVGIVGSSAATLFMRLILMSHAVTGDNAEVAAGREKLVTLDQKAAMLNPTVKSIAQEAVRGFA